jgi:glycosyltransferase involved in cell wall biosynthesis
MTASQKPLLLVLGAHEPSVDPREKWVCDMAAKDYEVEFVGIQDLSQPLPESEKWEHGYVHRLIRRAGYDDYILTELASLSQDPEEKAYWGIEWPRTIWCLRLLEKIYFSVGSGPSALLYFLKKAYYNWLILYHRIRNRYEVAKNYIRNAISKNPYENSMRRASEPVFHVKSPEMLNKPGATEAKVPNKAQNLNNEEYIKNKKRKEYFAIVDTACSAWQKKIAIFILYKFRPTFRLARFYWLLNYHFVKCNSLFIRHIEKMERKPAVVHCNDLETLMAGYWVKLKYGSKIIYDSHEYFAYSDVEAAKYHVRFFQKLEKLLVCHADAIVTVNSVLAEEIRRDYDLPVVISIPNAEPWLDARAPSEGEISKLAKGRVSFLFQGNFAVDRGLHELVSAWLKVDSEKAALFLRGSKNECRDAIEAQAKELGLLGSSIYVLEPVAVDNLVEAAAEADVGVIPYRPIHRGYKFCCPNKLSQYLHAGVMIVSNDLPYVKYVLDESKSGISYKDADVESIAAAINRATNDNDLRKRCRANARRYAHDIFNWQNFGRTFLELYDGGVRNIKIDISSPVQKRLIERPFEKLSWIEDEDRILDASLKV